MIRYVEDSVTQGSEVLSLTRRGAPPVHGGRAIRATIERGFASARARFELAIGIAKKLPTGTDPTFAARLPSINRRIQQGLDRTIETLKSARGHSGNNAFDRAILANHYCDYIDELTSSTGSTA